MSVRIGVDGASWGNQRGFGRFTRNVLTRLVPLDAQTRYVFFVDSSQAASLPVGAEAHVVEMPVPTSARRARPPLELVRLLRAARSEQLDAFLFPSVYSYFPVLGVPTIVGIHDTTVHDLPALTLPGWPQRLAWKAKETLALRRARRLFTVSKAARTALALRFGLEPERIAVVPEAPADLFRPTPGAERDLAALGLEPGPYVLYAAGISPHKNVERLLEAYAGLETAPQLVLVGSLDETYLSAREAVEAKMRTLALDGRVVLAGFVPDEALARLYSGAQLVVCPSLAEGFGLPPVEAAACGAPLVLSDLPAHRETLGDAALFFDPRDVAGLRDQLARALADEPLRRSLAERGQAAVGRLSWDASARALCTLVHEAAGA